MKKTIKNINKKNFKFLIPTIALGMVSSLLFLQDTNVINKQTNSLKLNKDFKNIKSTNTNDIELSENEYSLNENYLDGTIINKQYKFGISNSISIKQSNNNNWWSMWLNDNNPQILSFSKKFNFVANSFDPEKLTKDKIDENNETSNLLNFIMYDSASKSIESDILKNVKSSYKLNDVQNKYGFDIDNISTSTPLFNDKKLSTDNPLMLVTSKFYYGDDEEYKPIPVVIDNSIKITQVKQENFSKFGIYDRTDKKSWFSSGYFGFNKNRTISYYAPTKEQTTDDFKLDETKLNAISNEEKQLTAQEFFNLYRSDFSSLLQLNINNALPGTSKGKMIASIDNANGQIVFKFKPSFFYKIENDVNGNPIQKGLEENNNIEYTVGSISGFYTNTSRKQVNKDFESGEIGSNNTPSEVQENDIKKYIYQYRNEFWSQSASATSQSEQDVNSFFEIIGNLQPDNTNNKLTFTIRPKFKLVNGEKVENNDNALDVSISLINFVKKEDTSFVALETPKKEIYPSELQEYFNSSISDKEQLKLKLKEFVEIKGFLEDVEKVQIDKIVVEEHSNLQGTAKIKIWASNFRENDIIVSTSTEFGPYELTNLLKINQTIIKNELSYTPDIQGQYTVEKFIYELANNLTLSNKFLKDLESEQYQIIVEKPKDATITIEKSTNDVWYSNKDKTLNLVIKLSKYANENGDIVPGLQEGWPLKITLPNAIVPIAPTKIEGNIVFDNPENYLVSDVDDNMLKEVVWKNLTPKFNSNDELKDISKFPTNLDGSVISANKNIVIQKVNKDILNGTISFEYGLNLYYDETNLNTKTDVAFSAIQLSGFKKPDITKYNDDNKTIDISNQITTLNNMYANDFKDNNDLNNQELINKIKQHIQLSGNTTNTNITYQFSDKNVEDDYYRGELKIRVSINNAWVYDETAINSGFIKNENIDLGEFIVTGFKKYLNTSFNDNLEANGEYKINIKTLKQDNDTTANKIDWSTDNLQDLIFENRKTIFQDLPINISKEDIIIAEPQYKVDGADLNNPHIILNIKFKKAISNSVLIGETTLGSLKIYGFRKSQATIITPNNNLKIGNSQILAQEITNDNFNDNINVQSLSDFGIIHNAPENWNPDNSIQVEEITANSYNNKTGTIVAKLVLKNIYINDQEGRFPLGDSQPIEFTISGFKSVVSTALKSTVNNEPIKINIKDFSQTLATEVNLADLKEKIIENIKNILAENSYYKLGVENLTFTSADFVAINYDKNEGGRGSITFNNTFKINSYIDNDDKCTWKNGNDFVIPGQLIITGFKANEPTEINENKISNGIEIQSEQLKNNIAQNMSDTNLFNNIKDAIINQIFVEYFQTPVQKPGLLNNPSNSPIEKNDLDIQLVDNSWNNKDGSIKIKLILKKVINSEGIEVTDNNIPFMKEITIKGFKKVEETSIISNLNSNEMGDAFKNTKYNTYPQSIVENKDLVNSLKVNIEDWLDKENNIFKILENNDNIKQNELYIKDINSIPNDLYVIDQNSFTYSNKNGTVNFDININQKYTYTGESLLYNNLPVKQNIALKIGIAIPKQTIIKDKINIKENEQLSKFWPNQISDIKTPIIKILEEQRKNDPEGFIKNNLLFQNLPQEWANENFNLSDHIDINKIKSNDDDGFVSISVSIKDAPFFISDNNDNKFEKTFSSTKDKWNEILLTGFPNKGAFPTIPVALGSAALLVFIIILILAIYYLHKRRKYKTVTIANENEIK